MIIRSQNIILKKYYFKKRKKNYFNASLHAPSAMDRAAEARINSKRTEKKFIKTIVLLICEKFSPFRVSSRYENRSWNILIFRLWWLKYAKHAYERETTLRRFIGWTVVNTNLKKHHRRSEKASTSNFLLADVLELPEYPFEASQERDKRVARRWILISRRVLCARRITLREFWPNLRLNSFHHSAEEAGRVLVRGDQHLLETLGRKEPTPIQRCLQNGRALRKHNAQQRDVSATVRSASGKHITAARCCASGCR